MPMPCNREPCYCKSQAQRERCSDWIPGRDHPYWKCVRWVVSRTPCDMIGEITGQRFPCGDCEHRLEGRSPGRPRGTNAIEDEVAREALLRASLATTPEGRRNYRRLYMRLYMRQRRGNEG